MKTTEDNLQDSLTVLTAIINMHLNATNEEEYNSFKQMREMVYADYETEDLKRMVRNISRFFLSVWMPYSLSLGSDPLQSWLENVATISSKLEEDNDNS